MGYVKYREDDIEIYNDRIYGKNGLAGGIGPRSTVQFFECRYCHELFTDKNSLFLHIKTKHNIVKPILCVNGKVVSDNTVLQYIESCYIYTYGFSGQILLDGEVINSLEFDDSIDITDRFRAILKSKGFCEISFRNSTIKIELIQHHIESEALVAATMTKWQNAAEANRPLDVSVFESVCGADKIFLEGMYNYYVACNAKHDKAKRYDDAYAKLSLFNDIQGVGRCALKVIAFRRNWINSLKALSNDVCDVFRVACSFYENEELPEAIDSMTGEKALFIEDDMAKSLELISKFQNKKFEELDKCMPTLEKIEQLKDANVSDQLKLIKAKLEKKKGNESQCRRCVYSINNMQLQQIGSQFSSFCEE